MEMALLKYIISIIIFPNINNIIIIPFQTLNPLLYNNENLLELIKNESDKSIVDTISRNLIYTNLDIGNNIQTIPTLIEMNTKDLIIKDIFIHTNNTVDKTSNSIFAFGYNNLLNKIFSIQYYNSSTSQSYEYIRESSDYIYEETLFTFVEVKSLCGNESIFLMQKNNINDKETIHQVEFYISFKELDNNDHRPAILGLNYYNEFMHELKRKSEINNYYFSFNYTNPQEEKGELIIGDLPHVYDNKNYEEKNMRSTKINKDLKVEWSINFDIYGESKNTNKKEYLLEIDKIALFRIEESFITGSDKYLNYIENNFFRKYIDKNICKKEFRNKINYNNFVTYFICNI